MKRLVLALISVLFLAWVALIGWDRWVNAHRIVAGPENQTAFYRSYDPEQVIQHFRYDESYGSGHGSGLQLFKSIKHSEDFTPAFTMRGDREQELLNALREDIVQRLRMNGTNVTSIHDEPGGVHLQSRLREQHWQHLSPAAGSPHDGAPLSGAAWIG